MNTAGRMDTGGFHHICGNQLGHTETDGRRAGCDVRHEQITTAAASS